MNTNKTGLGRGLGALLSTDDTAETLNALSAPSSISEIDIALIHPNPKQPRHDFDETALDELAASIASIGIIQPITLREEEDGSYLIIAGERRFRAAQRAGLASVPAYIRKVSDDAVMEMALIENIQREDLNAIEVALAYQQLIEAYHLTQEQLSQRVGKNRTTIANFMRLLRLPAEIQLALKEKKLTQGHARALLPIEDPEQQVKLFHRIVAQDLSVRKVEQMVRDYVEGRILDFGEGTQAPRKTPQQEQKDLVEAMGEHLSNVFRTHVRMTRNDKGQGRITIPFRNDGELQHILALLDNVKNQPQQ